jgi:hypothetical protein
MFKRRKKVHQPKRRSDAFRTVGAVESLAEASESSEDEIFIFRVKLPATVTK